MFKPTKEQMEELLRARDYVLGFSDDFRADENFPNESPTLNMSIGEVIFNLDYIINMFGERM